MLVLYSFGWTGLTIGLVACRKPYLEYRNEQRRGVKREKYDFPRWCGMVAIASVTLMSFLGFVFMT